MIVNIRCCCDPRRVLGRVDVPAVSLERGARVAFALRDGSRLDLQVDEAGTSWIVQVDGDATGGRLEVVRRTELALRSDETPLARLRLIPGFVEVDRVELI